jgi:serine/threonine protein kinase/tetratricopeptide (TPR) repeat protein
MSETLPPDSPKIKEIFLQAVELPLSERSAFLDQACGNDPAVRRAVEELLKAEDEAGAFLAGPTVAPARQNVISSVGPGTRIGPYKLLQLIGEGGFGEVFMAEQETPVRRRVALKVIKAGMDSKQIVARFEAERQALAMMEHPNIARVFDAGTTELGLPYFVMELVKGVPVTQYCDEHRLTLRERLELFIPICQAVQHAHQKGVIHRDIKPSNVLVASHDGVASVKVIDFGIAKAMQTPLTNKTLFTEFRQLVGTPEYMSPEQAEFSSLDVDTRSDVYSLGVLLYELLAGAPPFDSRDLRSRAMDEMARIIREVDPPKPSTRVSTMETLGSIAAMRQSEPARLTGAIQGELDWIVMKCLEKDRSRRYESPSALAADISRHIAGEAVNAGPPSRMYRFRKSFRRHRTAYLATTIVAVALIAGLVVALLGLREARKQRDIAIAAMTSEAEAREYEKQTDTFLTELLTSVEPAEQRGKEVMVKELIDRGVDQLAASPPKHSVAEASLRFTFARAYASLGQWPKSRDQLLLASRAYESARGSDYIGTLKTRSNLGKAYAELGELDLAEKTLKDIIPRLQRSLGQEHDEVLTAQADLGQVLIGANKLDEASALLEPLAARAKQQQGANSDASIQFVSYLADLKYARGDLDGSIDTLKDVLDLTRKVHGEDHPNSISILQNLANALNQSGRVREAEPYLRKAAELAKKVLGENHADTLRTQQNLALNFWHQGKLNDSKELYDAILPPMRTILGDDNPSTLNARSNYGLVLQDMGRLDDAEQVFIDVADRYKRTQGEDYPNYLITLNNIAMVKLLKNDLPDAEKRWKEILPNLVRVMGDDHPNTHSLRMRLGRVLVLEGKFAEAEPLLKRSYDAAVANGIGLRQPGYALAYGDVLTKVGKHRDALPILEKAEELARTSAKKDIRSLRSVYENLIACATALNDPAAAEQWKAKLAELPAATSPTTTPAQ